MGCNLVGTILSDGSCLDIQEEQENHLNTLMREQAQIIQVKSTQEELDRMEILYRSLHNLDLSLDAPVQKEIPLDFDTYIAEYIGFATTENKISKTYYVPDRNTTVMHCVADLAADIIQQGNRAVDETLPLELSNSIARKLFVIEQATQKRVEHLTKLQRGSIVQAFILEDGEYQFIIAKVEHSEWYNGETLAKNFGFPGENKRVWKSAVINLSVEGVNVAHGNVKVFSGTGAQYWTKDFLEVKEANSDKVNTEEVLNIVNRELRRSVKAKSLYDYYNLKNSLNHALQSDQMINYPDLIGSLFDAYQPSEPSVNKEEIKARLLEKADSGRFDTQFHADPGVVNKNSRTKYRVNEYVNLMVQEAQPDRQKLIKAERTVTGEKVLIILCDDKDTFMSFDNGT